MSFSSKPFLVEPQFRASFERILKSRPKPVEDRFFEALKRGYQAYIFPRKGIVFFCALFLGFLLYRFYVQKKDKEARIKYAKQLLLEQARQQALFQQQQQQQAKVHPTYVQQPEEVYLESNYHWPLQYIVPTEPLYTRMGLDGLRVNEPEYYMQPPYSS